MAGDVGEDGGDEIAARTVAGEGERGGGVGAGDVGEGGDGF